MLTICPAVHPLIAGRQGGSNRHAGRGQVAASGCDPGTEHDRHLPDSLHLVCGHLLVTLPDGLLSSNGRGRRLGVVSHQTERADLHPSLMT